MSRIYWDSMLFIYWWEGGPMSEQVATVRQRMQDRGDRLCTAMLTRGEIMVRPYLTGAGPGVALPRHPLDARPGRGPREPQPGRVRASSFAGGGPPLREFRGLPRRLGPQCQRRGPRVRRDDLALVEKLRQLLRPPDIEIISFDEETADHFARIRAVYRVDPADAIHLASAARARANLFLTNDRALCRLHVPGIDFIAPLDTELF